MGVLVAGGTGALGQAVLRELVTSGYEVTATWIVERERERVEAELEDGVRLVRADLMEAGGAAAIRRGRGLRHREGRGAGVRGGARRRIPRPRGPGERGAAERDRHAGQPRRLARRRYLALGAPRADRQGHPVPRLGGLGAHERRRRPRLRAGLVTR